MAARLPKGGAAQQRRSSPQAPAARGSVPGDNRAALERAEQAQLLSFIARLRTQNAKTELAKKALDDEKAAEKEIYRLADAAGFKKAEVKEHLEDLLHGKTTDISDREVRRIRHRRWLGLAVGEEQTDLVSRMPDEARDEMYWAGEGFRQGLTFAERTLPDGMHTRFTQVFLSNFDKGKDEATRLIAANAPKPLGVREQAAADFAEAEPDIDLDAAARALKKDASFMDRTAPDDPAEGAKSEEAFEATPEELAAQKGRQALEDAREGRTSGGEVV